MSVFEDRIQELVAFQHYYGIASPSRKDPNDHIASLGRWVHRTRRNHRHGKLKLHHIQTLTQLGFEFTQTARRLTIQAERRHTFTHILTNMLSGQPLPHHQIKHYTILIKADHYGFLLPEHKSLLEQLERQHPQRLAA